MARWNRYVRIRCQAAKTGDMSRLERFADQFLMTRRGDSVQNHTGEAGAVWKLRFDAGGKRGGRLPLMARVEDEKYRRPEARRKLRRAAAATMRAVEQSHYAFDNEHFLLAACRQLAQQRWWHGVAVQIYGGFPARRGEKGAVDIVRAGLGGADIQSAVSERA